MIRRVPRIGSWVPGTPLFFAQNAWFCFIFWTFSRGRSPGNPPWRAPAHAPDHQQQQQQRRQRANDIGDNDNNNNNNTCFFVVSVTCGKTFLALKKSPGWAFSPMHRCPGRSGVMEATDISREPAEVDPWRPESKRQGPDGPNCDISRSKGFETRRVRELPRLWATRNRSRAHPIYLRSVQ